ncbi:hypothetical protein [Flavobacterium sp. UGB4466]|uniref:hypothetical protein n=1 Tax=Flavobacterium sp. UGB4466 TaxID=2730889 RepID=UPI00192B945E|nr:hypothetical protein [Flavobacterium sp. UGB4466]
MSGFKNLKSITEEMLFRSSSNIIEYCVIEEEGQELFNFCLNIQDSITHKISALETEKKDLEEDPNIYSSYDGLEFQNEDAICGLEEFEIPTWTKLLYFTVPLNQIILVNIYVEKSLKSLCSTYAPENTSTCYGGYSLNLKQEKGKSIIESYLLYLNKFCNFNINIPQSLEYLNSHIRNIRNNFVHGDWEKCKTQLEQIDINDLFAGTSELFEAIENEFLRQNKFIK